MRTKYQIDNLRFVLRTMIGPYEKTLTDTQINDWADNLQREVSAIQYGWQVQVKFANQKNLNWIDIPVEPTTPYSSESLIKEKCISLIKKYPEILEIKITDVLNENHTFYISLKEE